MELSRAGVVATALLAAVMVRWGVTDLALIKGLTGFRWHQLMSGSGFSDIVNVHKARLLYVMDPNFDQCFERIETDTASGKDLLRWVSSLKDALTASTGFTEATSLEVDYLEIKERTWPPHMAAVAKSLEIA